MKFSKESPIGFFDSGVGGLSVLKKALELMPEENYIYFGDSKNAPYGGRATEEVRELTFEAVDFLIKKGVKAVVVACNTATSAAINQLREKYSHIPIIGIEPALKPAVKNCGSGKVIIMATNVTLKEKKFNALMQHLAEEEGCLNRVVPLPCPGLVEFVEKGKVEGEEVKEFLNGKLAPYLKESISSIVLGCTHYPFVKETISELVGEEVPIIDGSEGTVRELKRKLIERELRNSEESKGSVVIYNSLENEDIIALSYKLLGIYNR